MVLIDIPKGVGIQSRQLPRFSDIECAALGRGVVLHARASGAIIASNETGARILKALRDGCSTQEIAADLAGSLDASHADASAVVESIVSLWQDAGLLSSEKSPVLDPVPYRKMRVVYHCAFQLGARRVVLRSENQTLLAQLKCSLQAYVVGGAASEHGRQDLLLEVLVDDGCYGLFRNGEAVWGAAPLDLTRFHIIRECMEYLCDPTRISTLLHAGAAAKNGKALILAGASGRGKTTLTLDLVNAGYSFAADDHVALHRDGSRMIAFPTASALKRGTRELSEGQDKQVLEDNAQKSPRKGVTYVKHSQQVAAGSTVPVGAIIFPEYKAAAQNQVTRLAPEEALSILIQTGGRLSRVGNSIEPLAALLDRVPSYRLSFRNSEFSVQTCLTL